MLKLFLLLGTLLYASIVDIKRQIVPTHIHVIIIAIGLISVSAASVIGAATAFFPFFVAALINPSQLGGGDVKLAAGCGFVMGGINGLWGLIIGLTLAIILVPAYRRLKAVPRDKPFPLVPFFFIGFLLHFFVNLLLN